jgi:hypothetical protein
VEIRCFEEEVHSNIFSRLPSHALGPNVLAGFFVRRHATYQLGYRWGEQFEYRWIVAPMVDCLTAPLARAYIRRNNATAMRRLVAQLGERESSERR